MRTTDAQLVGLTLVIKVLVFGWGLVAMALVNDRPVDLGEIFSIWNRWDAPHYLDVALFGYTNYDPGNLPMYSKLGDLDLFIVFYPLFPWATRVGLLFLPNLVAPIAVSAIASVAAVLLLFRLVAREFGERIGKRAAIFMLIFPTAYFLHIGYTESLFLALVLGSFLSARSDRWWLAGVAGRPGRPDPGERADPHPGARPGGLAAMERWAQVALGVGGHRSGGGRLRRVPGGQLRRVRESIRVPEDPAGALVQVAGLALGWESAGSSAS